MTQSTSSILPGPHASASPLPPASDVERQTLLVGCLPNRDGALVPACVVSTRGAVMGRVVEIASVPLPSQRTGRAGNPVVRILDVDGALEFEIAGLDLSNFEAVVGPAAAEEYREFVRVRRRRPGRR